MTTHDKQHIELDLHGMTCAGCATRIEQRLNKIDGVDAEVNFATERASVHVHDDDVSADTLIAHVSDIGYGATVHDAHAMAGHDGHDHARIADARELRVLRVRAVLAAALSVPIVALSMVPALQFAQWQWLALALATPVITWCAWPIHRATLRGARHGSVGMDALITVGTSAAYLWSLAALVWGDAGSTTASMHMTAGSPHDSNAAYDVYFEVAAAVIAFVLAGRYYEHRSKRDATRALRAMLNLEAQHAVLVDAMGMEREVSASSLAVGDTFVVKPGEKIATDGVIVEGESSIDASLVTGESMPRGVTTGDEVIGATINVSGRIVVRASRVGRDTVLAQISRLVEQAQSGKAPIQRLADRVAGIFVPIVFVISAATFAGWLMADATTTFAIGAAVAVLIVACPCALGLATPMALLVGTGRGAQLGLLIKGPEILESTRRIDTIVIDKTGTITSGEMTVVDVATHGGFDRDALLQRAAQLERASEHPIAKAIVGATAAAAQSTVTSFRNHPGKGVEGVVDGSVVLVGTSAFMNDWSLTMPPQLEATLDRAQASGFTAVCVAIDGSVAGVISVADTVKETSAAAIEQLRALGLTPIMMTGDNERTARAIAHETGIDQVYAGVLPADKAQHVGDLQAAGKVVAMVGDGVNDAPALAQADLGLAMGTGTDVAMEASDLTIMSGDLRDAAAAIRLSRRTLGTIKGNLFWAFAYNVAAIPIAALGLLNPMFAGAAMALSSVFVVSNSLRLRRFTPQRS